MPSTHSLRSHVVARAGGACEYCRLVESATGVTFHVEHIQPVARGGKTILSNLALSCPGCNFAKADRIEGPDSEGVNRALFNPREYEPWLLGWHLHFAIQHETGEVMPRSETGEATVLTLQMNSAARLFARRLQIRAGLIA